MQTINANNKCLCCFLCMPDVSNCLQLLFFCTRVHMCCTAKATHGIGHTRPIVLLYEWKSSPVCIFTVDVSVLGSAGLFIGQLCRLSAPRQLAWPYTPWTMLGCNAPSHYPQRGYTDLCGKIIPRCDVGGEPAHGTCLTGCRAAGAAAVQGHVAVLALGLLVDFEPDRTS